MSLNIGSLVGYLELDDRNFTRKADQAEKKIVGLKSSLEALAKSDPKLKLRVEAETAKLDEIHARLTDLKAQAARGIDVRVDTAKAMAELAALDARIRSMPDVDIKTDRAIRNVSALGVAIAVLAPTIGTVTASTVGMSVAIGGVFAAGAAGLGLWAKIAQSAVKDTMKQAKAIDAAKKAADSATDPKVRAAALEKYNLLLGNLSKRQARFLDGQGKLQDAWKKLASSGSVFGPLNSGMALLTSILPKLKPLLDTVSDSLTTSLDGVQKWVDGGSFDKFIAGWAKLAGPSITVGLKTLGNLAKGFGGMAQAFGPMGMQMLDGLEHASESFAKWGDNSAGLQQFVAYVSENGPKLLSLLGDVTSALVHLGIATAPMGNMILTVLSGLAKGINAIPVELLGPLAVGLLSVNLALKALAMTSAASSALGMVKTTEALAGLSRVKFAGVVGGLGAVAASAGSGSKAMGVLGGAVGGALAGFSVGGPWGAAIGGVAGGLFGLVTASHKSAKAMDESIPSADALAASLRGVAGAATDAARQQAIMGLSKSGALKAGRAAGLTPAQMAGAAMGNANAQAQVDAQIAAARARAKAELDAATARQQAAMKSAQGVNGQVAPSAADEYKKQALAHQASVKAYKDEMAALDGLSAKLGATAKNTAAARQQIWLAQQVTSVYARSLKQLPPAVQTTVQAMNVAPTLRDIAKISRQYHLTPKQITSLIKATGVEATLADVQRVIERQKGIERVIPVTVTFSTSGMAGVLGRAQQLAADVQSALAGAGSGGSPKPKRKKANGGRLSGPGSGTSDSIDARVSNGEYIVNAKSTALYLPMLEAMNAQKFANGGRVGGKKKAANRKHDQSLLEQYMALLAATNTNISDARGFGAAFAGNVFSQGFTGASGAMSAPQLLNGAMVSTSTGPTSSGMLAQMMAYQQGQYSQGKQLQKDITRLQKAGVSKSLILKMQAAGESGIAEIHALAGGSTAQIKQFNSLSRKTDAMFNDAGAIGLTGAPMASLQRQKQSEQSMVKAIQQALKHGVKVSVVNGHLRTVG